MKKALITLSAIIAISVISFGQLRLPAPSPTENIKQDFALSSIEVNYSRPGMKGRKIFGDLVPFGKIWRTGANSATRIRFNDDVMIGGLPVMAGEYALYTVPNENGWEIILNKGAENEGLTGYKFEDDVARFRVVPVKLSETVETFSMQFRDLKPASVNLRISWENTAVDLPIKSDIDAKVMAQINQAMNVDNKPYFQAASYYADNGKDLNQAITWFDKAIEQNPKGYYIYYQKANALAKMGKKSEAIATAQKSMEIAREQKNDDYVRLNEKLIAGLK